MAKAVPDPNRKKTSSKFTWKTTTIVTWVAVVGMVVGLTIYLGRLVNSNEAQQVRKLKQELDSISDREYQIQYKIDSLSQLDRE